jgi:hypothetical protein
MLHHELIVGENIKLKNNLLGIVYLNCSDKILNKINKILIKKITIAMV